MLTRKEIVPLFLAAALLSCSKKGTTTNSDSDTAAPVVTIISPTSNEAFTAGQTIQMSATATDNVKLTELHIHVLNKTTGALLRDIHSYPDNKSGTVQDAFIAEVGRYACWQANHQQKASISC